MKKSGKRKLRKWRKRYQSSDAIEKVEVMGAKTERQNDELTIEKRRRVV